LDALLENIFSHTPDGTAFSVTLTARAEGGAVLEVADAGPGFPSDAGSRGSSAGGSTGLGLDIARQVARVFEVKTSASGGAVVRLEISN
jgi:signal transduction histidine kinase